MDQTQGSVPSLNSSEDINKAVRTMKSTRGYRKEMVSYLKKRTDQRKQLPQSSNTPKQQENQKFKPSRTYGLLYSDSSENDYDDSDGFSSLRDSRKANDNSKDSKSQVDATQVNGVSTNPLLVAGPSKSYPFIPKTRVLNTLRLELVELTQLLVRLGSQKMLPVREENDHSVTLSEAVTELQRLLDKLLFLCSYWSDDVWNSSAPTPRHQEIISTMCQYNAVKHVLRKSPELQGYIGDVLSTRSFLLAVFLPREHRRRSEGGNKKTYM